MPIVDEMSPCRILSEAVPFQEPDTIVPTSSCDVPSATLPLVCGDSDSQTGSMRYSGVLILVLD